MDTPVEDIATTPETETADAVVEPEDVELEAPAADAVELDAPADVPSAVEPGAAEDLAQDEAEPSILLSALQQMTEDFGADIALSTVLNGGTYEDAKAAHVAAILAENEELRKQLATRPTDADVADPVEFGPADDLETKPATRYTGRRGIDAMASAIAAETANKTR